MRILAISDIHGYIDLLLKVLEKEVKVDLILFAGDIAPYKAPYKTREYLLRALEIANMYKVKLFISVPGNMDIPKHYNEISANIYVYLHNDYKIYENIVFVGFGGTIKSPFNTILEYDDVIIEQSLLNIYNNIKNLLNENNILILLTHTPPYNTKCDIAYTKEHIGSKGIRRFIEMTKPLLVVCGHVHESRCIDKIDKSFIVNPGPLFKGFYAIIEMKDREVFVHQKSLI
jgi:Icc-related predicted phosphoesterase